MGWWGGCPGSWEAQGNAGQCCVVTVKVDKEIKDLSPFRFTLFFFLFQHHCQLLRQVKLDKLKRKIKRLHGCVLALNSKNRLFNFALWTVKAIRVSLRIASCLNETYSLCIFWHYDSLASFNQILRTPSFLILKKVSILNSEQPLPEIQFHWELWNTSAAAKQAGMKPKGDATTEDITHF